MEPITLDELLKAVEDASESGEGFTTGELCAAQSISPTKARALIRRALDQGLVRPARKAITDMSGRTLTVASYMIIRLPHKTKRRKS